MHTKFTPKRSHSRSLGNSYCFLRATGLGTGRFCPPKWSLFGAFGEPEEAFSKRFHENSLRNHAPHSSQKHIFIKNIKTYEKMIEKKVLNSACTQGRQNHTRSLYPRWPPKTLVWQKWLWLEPGLHCESKFEGNFVGCKGQGDTFSLNLGCEMELLFKLFNTGDFQNYACHSSQKQNSGKL